ncbi:MAG: hypothetical protein RR528_07525, partial [Angelakisella sp.]
PPPPPPPTPPAEAGAAARRQERAPRPRTDPPAVTRVDDGKEAHTAAFAAHREAPKAPAAPQKKLSDAELFGDIPMGVPIVSGDRPAAPKVQEQKPEAKHEPKKIEGTLYGKI